MKKIACPALIVVHFFLTTGGKAWAVTDEDLDQVRADMTRVLLCLEALEGLLVTRICRWRYRWQRTSGLGGVCTEPGMAYRPDLAASQRGG